MSSYGDSLAAVGLNPDNPDGMYSELQKFLSNPQAYKQAQGNWKGNRDNYNWTRDSDGRIHIQWPFHYGRWMSNAPQNDAQVRAVFKVPAGVDTTAFLSNAYSHGQLGAFPVPANYYIDNENWDKGSPFGDVGKWVGNAVSSAGREIGHAAQGVADAAGKVGDLVKKIPVVGAPLEGIFDGAFHAVAAPWHALGDVVSGHADKAFDDFMKDNKTAIHEVGPYAQMVLSVVPGIGTGVSAAIGAGISLADGQPITKALMAGLAGAIPGGPAVQAAFSAGMNVISGAVSGKGVDAGALAASAAQAASSLGQGVQLPQAAQDAMQAGMAVGTAVQQQADRAQQLLGSIGGKLSETGIQLSKVLPEVGAARQMLNGQGLNGFDLGSGLLSHQIKPFDFHTIRDSLNDLDKKGFDAATSLKIGLVAHPAPANLSPAAKAGHAMTMGMQGGHPDSNTHIMSKIAAHPSGIVGAKVAIGQIQKKKEEHWFVRLLRALHLHK